LRAGQDGDEFRYGFGNTLTQQESDELYQRWTIPSPGKPLFEDAFANFTPQSPAKVNTHNKTRGPLLLIAGGRDHTVPAAITTATRRLYHKSPSITDLPGVSRPWPLTDHRPRLARGRSAEP
jgi:non-heme chloroperoxidase